MGQTTEQPVHDGCEKRSREGAGPEGTDSVPATEDRPSQNEEDDGNHQGEARQMDTTVHACAEQRQQERGGKDDAQDDNSAGQQ